MPTVPIILTGNVVGIILVLIIMTINTIIFNIKKFAMIFRRIYPWRIDKMIALAVLLLAIWIIAKLSIRDDVLGDIANIIWFLYRMICLFFICFTILNMIFEWI